MSAAATSSEELFQNKIKYLQGTLEKMKNNGLPFEMVSILTNTNERAGLMMKIEL